MLRRYEAIFIPPGSTTPKLQKPLQVLWKSTLLRKTKLRENATNNPRRRCTCSKHGFHPGGHIDSRRFRIAEFKDHAYQVCYM